MPAKTRSEEFTVVHAGGVWALWRGGIMGRVVIPTASMGKTIGTHRPLGENPRDVENRLLSENAAQFGIPDVAA